MLKGIEREKKIVAVVPKMYFSQGNEYDKEEYKESEVGRVIWVAG